jgi:hypothetical protein
MLIQLFKCSLTMSFMLGEEYTVGNLGLTNVPLSYGVTEGRVRINDETHFHPQTHRRTG